jgi:hypothetical protein
MKRTLPRKLTLTRESLHRLERQDLEQAIGAVNTDRCKTNISCMVGCNNYTAFGTCTC